MARMGFPAFDYDIQNVSFDLIQLTHSVQAAASSEILFLALCHAQIVVIEEKMSFQTRAYMIGNVFLPR